MNKVLNYYNKVRDYNIFIKEEIEQLEKLNNKDDESFYIKNAFLSLLTSISNNNYYFDLLQFLRDDYHMLYCSKWRITDLRRYLKQQSQDEDTLRLLGLLKKLSKNFDYKYLLAIDNTEETWLEKHYPTLKDSLLSRDTFIVGTNSVGYEIITFYILNDYELGYLINVITNIINNLINNAMSIPTTLIRLYNKIRKVLDRVLRLTYYKEED